MKKSVLKITAMILLTVLLLSFTACGKINIRELHAKDLKDELVVPASPLNAQTLYKSIEYTPEMFMGSYYLNAGTDSEEDYLENSLWWTTTLDSYNGEPYDLTLIPFMFRVGPENFLHKLNRHTNHVWGEFHFKNRNGNLIVLECAVEVKNNNTLCLTPVESFEYNEETDSSVYTLSDTVLEYGFAFRGTNLTLTSGSSSVELQSTYLTDHSIGQLKYHQICVDSYLKAKSPQLDNIIAIDFLSNDKKAKVNRFYLKVTDEESDSTENYEAVGYLGEDGLFTFSYTDENGAVHSYQALYFYLDNDGIILYDGNETYYYTNRYASDLDAIISEEQAEQAANLSDSAIDQILKTKASLFEALSKAFAEAGIAAAVDPVSGEISIDSAVLFDVNKADISAEGQTFLTDFWSVYTSVLAADEYDGFLESIIVEGHADPSGNYDDNMILSENRANSVLEFCSNLGGSVAPLESIGYSSDRPIVGEDGEVDYDASRRVAFRFRIKL